MILELQVAYRNEQIKRDLDNMVKGLSTPTFTGFKLHNRYRYQGMDISIENRKGSYRHWKDEQGNEGKSKMCCDYGYIRRTLGNDGDHIDCFVRPEVVSDIVFIIHQNDPKTGKYDEDKVMLGFTNGKDAKQAYLSHYDTPKFFGSMDQMMIDEFKDKVLGKVVKKIK